MDKKVIKRALNSLKLEQNEPQIIYWLGKGLNNGKIAKRLSTNSTNIFFQRKTIDRLLQEGGVPEITLEVYSVIFETVGDPPDWSQWPPKLEATEPETEVTQFTTADEQTQTTDEPHALSPLSTMVGITESTEEPPLSVVETDQSQLSISEEMEPSLESTFPSEIEATEPETKNPVIDPWQSIENETQIHEPVNIPPPQQQANPISSILQEVPRTWLSIAIAVASIFGFVLCWLAVIGVRDIFTGDESSPTVPIVIVQSEATGTPTTTQTSIPDTSNVTQTLMVEETQTAVSMAETATAAVTKTPTSTRTPTAVPSDTPTITPTPTATETPTITPFPTPNITLPWSDNFNNGRISEDWEQVSGSYLITNFGGNGILRSERSTISNGGSCSIFKIGNEGLTNFFIEMDYGGHFENFWKVQQIAGDRFEIVLGERMRLIHEYPNSHAFLWEVYIDGVWTTVKSESGHDFSEAQHARFEFHNNNRYVALLDGSSWMDFVYPLHQASGQITIQICNFTYIDNVRIGYLD